jgi:hypothetical protein
MQAASRLAVPSAWLYQLTHKVSVLLERSKRGSHENNYLQLMKENISFVMNRLETILCSLDNDLVTEYYEVHKQSATQCFSDYLSFANSLQFSQHAPSVASFISQKTQNVNVIDVISCFD